MILSTFEYFHMKTETASYLTLCKSRHNTQKKQYASILLTTLAIMRMDEATDAKAHSFSLSLSLFFPSCLSDSHFLIFLYIWCVCMCVKSYHVTSYQISVQYFHISLRSSWNQRHMPSPAYLQNSFSSLRHLPVVLFVLVHHSKHSIHFLENVLS